MRRQRGSRLAKQINRFTEPEPAVGPEKLSTRVVAGTLTDSTVRTDRRDSRFPEMQSIAAEMP